MEKSKREKVDCNNNNNNNKAKRINYIKAEIDNQNWIANVGYTERKLVQQEDKARHRWVGKMIHWELYKKLEFSILTNVIIINLINPKKGDL